MEIRNAVLLQGLAATGERRIKLSEDLSTIKRGSRYRVFGELLLADVCQHPTLAIALEQFGDVDLVLVETYDAIRGQFGLFDDFIDFGIKLVFIDDLMNEFYVLNEILLEDSEVSKFIDMNTEEIESLTSVGKYKLKQALRGYDESQPRREKSHERYERIYRAMEDIVRSGEALMLGGISIALQKRGFDARGKDGKSTPFHESHLLRIANRLGKKEKFNELRQSHQTKRNLTPR